jgi:predicted DCC family thiol-disulfide oxidoreductase YuxK
MPECQPQVAGLYLYYDGDCPLCRSYVTRMRLRHSAGSVELVNVRIHAAERQRLERQGYRLDDGMVVEVGGQVYHGAAAVHVLALLSSRSGWFNRLNYRVFRSRRTARLLYPPLVAGRRVLLFLLGRKPLPQGEYDPPDNPKELRKVP